MRTTRLLSRLAAFAGAAVLAACSGPAPTTDPPPSEPTSAAESLVEAIEEAGDEATTDPDAEPTTEAATPPLDTGLPGSTVIVLDASASMLAEDMPQQRFAAVADGLDTVLDGLPQNHEAGLLVFGTESSADEVETGCSDVTELVPVGGPRISAAVAGVVPRGGSPIGLALERAEQMLPPDGPRSILLVTDGMDSCAELGLGPDPCTVASELAAEGDLRISMIGIRLDPRAAQQLSCISEHAGGTAVSALNAQQLEARLTDSYNPGARPASLSARGYAGLTLGLSSHDAREYMDLDQAISSTGTVQVPWRDAVVTFRDGVLTEISTTAVATVDGLAVGDDASVADALYADPLLPPFIEEGTVEYVADQITRASFRFAIDDADGGEPDGPITRITLLARPGQDLYAVPPPSSSAVPDCEVGECVIHRAIVAPHPTSGAVLVMFRTVARNDGTHYSDGQVVMLDHRGELTELTESHTVEGHYSEGGGGNWTPGEFPDPLTDRTGAIFVEVLSYSGSNATRISFSPSGDPLVLDAFADVDPGALRYAFPTWDRLDVNGHYIATLETDAMGTGEMLEAHWDGERYVVE